MKMFFREKMTLEDQIVTKNGGTPNYNKKCTNVDQNPYGYRKDSHLGPRSLFFPGNSVARHNSSSIHPLL